MTEDGEFEAARLKGVINKTEARGSADGWAGAQFEADGSIRLRRGKTLK